MLPVRSFSTSTTLRNTATTVPPTIKTPAQPTISVPTAPTTDAPQIDFTTVPTIDNFDSLKAQTVTNIVTQVDSWASPFNPVNWAVDLIEWTHDATGLPWWATIAVIGFSMRLISSPLNIIGTKNSVAMANHGDEMKRLQQRAVC
jgi:membrane protein insertase Oxa1/YidC/SpoIIIJ